MVGGSGISWTICKSFAPRFRQMATPVPHHSVLTGQINYNHIASLFVLNVNSSCYHHHNLVMDKLLKVTQPTCYFGSTNKFGVFVQMTICCLCLQQHPSLADVSLAIRQL